MQWGPGTSIRDAAGVEVDIRVSLSLDWLPQLATLGFLQSSVTSGGKGKFFPDSPNVVDTIDISGYQLFCIQAGIYYDGIEDDEYASACSSAGDHLSQGSKKSVVD